MTPAIDYIAQGIAIVFALVAGYHDGPAIRVFHEKGYESPKKNRQFHHSGAFMRAIVIFLLALLPGPDIREMVFTAATCGVWVYMLFDVACGIWGHAGSWHYLGSNDGHGNTWRKWFGRDAGKVKVSILILIWLGLTLTKEFIIK